MQVLVLCKLSDEALLQFDAYALEVRVFHPESDVLQTLLPQFQALVIDHDFVMDAEMLALAKECTVIATLSKDISNIDLELATEMGITVINVSRSISGAIAEFTLWQMFTLARFYSAEPFELKNKVLGIIGMGNVGAQVAKRAHALQMQVLCYDPYLSSSRSHAYQVQRVELADLLIASDIVSIHTPLTEETADLLGYDRLLLMKKNALLINNAHPSITPYEDLARALTAGPLGALAMDLPEEWTAHDGLIALPNAIVTRKKAQVTRESAIGIGKELSDELHQIEQFSTSHNAINLPVVPEYQQDLYRPMLLNATFAGTFLGQYVSDAIEEIVLYEHAPLPDPAPLIHTFLTSFLLAYGLDNVNYVNALTLAYRNNIRIRTEKGSGGEKGLGVKISTEKLSYGLTVHTDHEENIIITAIDSISFTALPAEHILLIWHKPQPGVVGLIGTALGACGINISGMVLNETHADEERSVIFINIDRALDQDVLNGIAKYENVFAANYVHIAPNLPKHFV